VSNTKPKVANQLVGIAGVHFVVSELSLRGLIALPTIKNTAGVDVIVASADGSWHANLQVKTSQKRVTYWPVGTRFEQWRGKNNFYVFVRFLEKESRFEAFLESADRVIQQVKARSKKAKLREAKGFPSWSLPEGNIESERLCRKWREFGQGYSTK